MDDIPDHTPRQSLPPYLFETSRAPDHQEKTLLWYAQNLPPQDESLLYEVILDLFKLQLPTVVLALFDPKPSIKKKNNFQHLILEGAASLLVEDLQRAKSCYLHAHQLRPEEPAPYGNLAQIYLHTQQYPQALQWLEQGFSRFPQHSALWEHYYSYQLCHHDHTVSTEHVRQRAHQLQSWMGYLLYYELLLSSEPESEHDTIRKNKAQQLACFYAQEERDPFFLTEYLGALGESGQHTKIPALIWQIHQSGQTLPWKMELQHAQALLAESNPSQAHAILQRLETRQDLPPQAHSYIQSLREHAADPLSEQTLS